MLHLAITHNIHLSKEECYKLHEQQEVQTISVSIPVWHSGLVTSEPAKEVFCQYILRNTQQDIPVQILKEGYLVHLPYRPANEVKPLTDEEWRFLNMNDQEKLRDYYRSQKPEVSAKNLLDLKDGGSGCLMYREHNTVNNDGKQLNLMHFVNIRRDDHLIESLTWPEDIPSKS